jgi:photosynthetic reaction center cytochrome c subunit
MSFRSKPLVLAAAGMAVVGLSGLALVRQAAAQAVRAPAPAVGKTAGEAFKNVTTATLKPLTVDDFLGTMGVMAAALGYDCADCHPGAGTDKADFVIDTPKKRMARRMVDMVAGINKTYFGNVQNVTCFTCHHGRDLPSTTIALDKLYGPPNEEKTDVIEAGVGVPSATSILDKYIAAVGGAQKLATLKSYEATGSSLGYEGLGGGGSFQIFAKAPDQRAVVIEFKDHPERGDSARLFDGREGWVKSPRGLLGNYTVTGNELEGMKLDAVLSFPGQVKTALTNWRVGNDDVIDGNDVHVVQGRGPKGLLATLYFDTKTGYLLRLLRYSASPIGHIPTQVDYSDYRDVNGIKFPFKYTFSWLDGKDAFQLREVKLNVPIDQSKFEKPAGN